MAKCRTCGIETYPNQRICSGCLGNWSDMRTEIHTVLTDKYGKMNPDNHQQFIKETKRLERIWRKDKDKFQKELDKIKP